MPEVNKTPDAIRFGPFELWVETGELRKNGVPLRLHGQPIEVLTLLVKTPGRLVTREELQRHLWRTDVFTDFEKGLNAAVNRLREYLGDSATEPRYIETVPGRGYRFIAKVLDRTDVVGPGKTVSHYRILEILGRGGMGVVYKAQDLKLGRLVALKFLPEESATNHEALERFRREASTASSLNHPNICTIYEIEEHEGQPFIVMELLQGQTLREYLISSPFRRNRLEPVLDTDQLLDIALQVLDGLQAAHLKGIIHRDIKPTNIFVTDGRLVKILDFGLAKLIGTVSQGELETLSALAAPNSGDPPEHLSEVGAAIGAFGYMAPEQARGEDLDARADLFSFGLVVYEMAAGRPAFNGTTPAELCHAILTETPVPIRKLNPSIPPALEQVIDKALDKDRERRYQSATELRADLIRVKQGVEPPKVSGPEWPITQQETRFLEAAAPKEATVGRSIEVMAMVRENESAGGLREFLRTEEAPRLTAEDVRERSFDVEFPLDEKAKPQPLDITLRLESPGFDPPSQVKKLKMPPRGDSPACAFFITPRLVGELVLNLELLNCHEQVVTSRSIRTKALPAGSATSLNKIVVTIPLTLSVRRIGDQIIEVDPVSIETSLLDRIVEGGRLATDRPSDASKRMVIDFFDPGTSEISKEDVDLVGTNVSHYRLLKVIRGWGDRGTLYQAADQEGGHQVAFFLLGQEVNSPSMLRVLTCGLGGIHEHNGRRFVVRDLHIEGSAKLAGPPELLDAPAGEGQPAPQMESSASDLPTEAPHHDSDKPAKVCAEITVFSTGTPRLDRVGGEEVSGKVDLTGQTFSHYRFLRIERQGGFGMVYEAEDLHTGRPVLLYLLGKKPDDPWVQRIESGLGEIREHEGQRFAVSDPDEPKLRGRLSGSADRPGSSATSVENRDIEPHPPDARRAIWLIGGGILTTLVIVAVINLIPLSLPSRSAKPSAGVPRTVPSQSPNASPPVDLDKSYLPLPPSGVASASKSTSITKSTSIKLSAAPSSPLHRGDTVVLANFANSTDDPAFNGLNSVLNLSPSLDVLSQEKVSDVLKSMNHGPDEPLTPEFAREVCLRANCKAVIVGSVSLVGTDYKIALRAIDCKTGRLMAVSDGKAANRNDVSTLTVAVAADLLRQLLGPKS